MKQESTFAVLGRSSTERFVALFAMLSCSSLTASAETCGSAYSNIRVACYGVGTYSEATFFSYGPAPLTIFHHDYTVTGSALPNQVYFEGPGLYREGMRVFGSESAYGQVDSSIAGNDQWTSSSGAWASLATGSLKARGSSGIVSSTYPTSADWTSSTVLRDVLTLNVPAGFTGFELSLRLQLNGVVSRPTATSVVAGDAKIGIPDLNGSWVAVSFLDLGTVSGQYNGTLSIDYVFSKPEGVVGDWSVRTPIFAELLLTGRDQGSADFSHSAYLHVQAPPGVTYVSDSGVLLASSVPEPTSIALLLSGLSLMYGRFSLRKAI